MNHDSSNSKYPQPEHPEPEHSEPEHPSSECRQCMDDALNELRDQLTDIHLYSYDLSHSKMPTRRFFLNKSIKSSIKAVSSSSSSSSNSGSSSSNSSSSSSSSTNATDSEPKLNPPEQRVAERVEQRLEEPGGDVESTVPTASTEPSVPVPHNDDSLNYLREYISRQMQERQVSTVKLGVLPKTKETIDIANRVAHLLTQERILAKLNLLNKYMDVLDWSSAWEEVRNPIEKVQAQDERVKYQLVYSLYARLLRNDVLTKLEKFLNQNFPSNLKSVETVINRMEPLVQQEVEGKRPISLVKESTFSYDIITMTKAIAKQFIWASLLKEMMLVSTRSCSIGSIILKSDDDMNEQSLLEAYQYLCGTVNDPFREQTVKRFREWFINGDTFTMV
jgi:hypothetical protein